MEEITLKTWDHVLFFFIGVLFPVISLMQKSSGVQLPEFDSRQKRTVYITNSLFMWLPALVIILTWLFHNRSLGSFWFAMPEFEPMAWPYLFLFIILYLAETIWSIRSKAQIRKAREKFKVHTPFMPSRTKELPSFSFMAITAGFTEEIIFRAFCMHYLFALLPLSGAIFYVIILVPAIIFAIVHLYQGTEAVVKILAFGMLIGLIYFYTKSLWIVIAIHFLVDMIGGLISVYIIHNRDEINSA